MAIETKKKKSKKLQIRAIGGKPLPDELLKPITQRSQNMILLGIEDNADYVIKIEQYNRMRMLVQFLGCDLQKDGNAAYAWALFKISCEFIPGFQVELNRARSGRKRGWTVERCDVLVSQFNKVRSTHPEWSQSQICTHLLKNPSYKVEWVGTAKKTLENRLKSAIRTVDNYKAFERYVRRYGCFPRRVPGEKASG